MPATSQELSLRGRLGAQESWARTSDRTGRTAPARKAFNDRFLKQVDPEGVLPEKERQQRAEQARKAFYTRMALKSVQARRARR